MAFCACLIAVRYWIIGKGTEFDFLLLDIYYMKNTDSIYELPMNIIVVRNMIFKSDERMEF